MVELETTNNYFSLIPYNQCTERPEVTLMNNEEKRKFNDDINHLNSIIEDDEQLSDNYDQYLKNNSNLCEVFAPYTGRIASFLCRHHFLPTFISKKKKMQLLA